MNEDLFLKIDIASLLKSDRKGAKRQMQIANRAIKLLGSKSMADFSFEVLAKKCQVTRTLIYRYFASYESLIIFLSVLIRHRYQEMVIERMQTNASKDSMFTSYLYAAFDWVDIYPDDASVWLIYFHQCSVVKKLALLNCQLVDMGAQRIEQLLRKQLSGDSQIDPKDIQTKARLIQFVITGYLTARATESRSNQEWSKLKEASILNCIFIATGIGETPKAV